MPGSFASARSNRAEERGEKIGPDLFGSCDINRNALIVQEVMQIFSVQIFCRSSEWEKIFVDKKGIGFVTVENNKCL